jgi:hypothetical protein
VTSRSRRVRAPLLALAASLCVAARCVSVHVDANDPMLHLDAIDPITQQFLEMTPEGRPLAPGPDGIPDTDDDVLLDFAWGDIDLVLRTGMTSFSGWTCRARAPSSALPRRPSPSS